MRQIILDTETTGLDPRSGHRIIEIGCVEMINRKLTGNNYHQYIHPDREVEAEAIEVHGITNEFLEDKPKFEAIAHAFFDYIKGAELVIHNAAFDVGFIDHEFALLDEAAKFGCVADHCSVVDTLMLARKKHRGQKNNLDALCKRYEIDNGHRTLHGALLDAEILADVYLAMTGGQTQMSFDGGVDAAHGQDQEAERVIRLSSDRPPLKVIKANQAEIEAHQLLCEKLEDNLAKW